MGRPKLNKVRHQVRLTREEDMSLTALSELCDMTPTAFIREAVLNLMRTMELPPPAKKEKP
jgi:hypothetical protein